MANIRSMNLFDRNVNLQLNGKSFSRIPLTPSSRKALQQQLRNNFTCATSIEEKFLVLESLETLNADLGELGFDVKDAKSLLRYYQDNIAFSLQRQPDIAGGFKALSCAAELMTNHASRPALMLASLYANELVPDHPVLLLSGHSESFSEYYNDFVDVLSLFF